MEGTTQELLAAATRAGVLELHAAMRTGVDEGTDAVVAPDDDHRVVANVVDVEVADFRDLLLSTSPLPRARPHVRHLTLEKRLVGIAREGNVVVAEKLVTPARSGPGGVSPSRAMTSFGVGPGQRASPGASSSPRM